MFKKCSYKSHLLGEFLQHHSKVAFDNDNIIDLGLVIFLFLFYNRYKKNVTSGKTNDISLLNVLL